MNRLTKLITVRFFEINANDTYFDDFVSIHKANRVNEKNVRIINIRDKKHLIKIHDEPNDRNYLFFLSVVRERITWQIRALGNGKITGIPLNQGIIGDPYYFMILPYNKIIFGFTTGPIGSLKSVASSVLQQFNKDRTSIVTVDHISEKKEFSKLRELSGYNKLYFKIDTTSLGDINDETPGILRELCSSPFISSKSQIALTFSEIGKDGFAENDLIEIVDYLSENDGCSALTVQGLDKEGVKVHLDFSKAYIIYKTKIELRNKFIDENNAKTILNNALIYLNNSKLLNS